MSEKQLTAAQRLMGLEQSAGALDQALYNQARQLSVVRDGLSLLHEKLNAVIKLMSLNAQVNDQAIDNMVEQVRVDGMKEKVSKLLEDSSIKSAEEVSNKSFLVVREINLETGKIVNPRLQFAISVLNEESITKLVGKKKGDAVNLLDSSPIAIEIEEIYDVVVEETEQLEQSEQPEQA